ncbi:MAG: hypothetical protein A3B89_02710 [Candidatus Buchananbacteria bacterium RIFCSPHIGHO2_02_FULL_40_13]|uniref:Uncharacterized protein n=1 Tax=Candidatus Buchananbacteria bacterium RIFCSPLOWO2_01_FULL_39_33 TaxID=1797543 RepID=A0A1G1YHU8_9BACT|nr:MAG: hypothetical protein A2820_02285 [Candidatus Buchananbacteria bacterium RIFCSPHIGHO2_01_FULL_40_35]OGY49921.1 MAG: hypothetical protein A3B89_02710 [Candidatus Buchananbacteria bacterium RIFCSPHIGHO2_02_FULL_40_13]OGY51938.1 MAG: hypothetical protein A3A02_01370 [Candidatus Buchananbacteria bacterium RIFCSPLOWO2_01_FULL_39_33]
MSVVLKNDNIKNINKYLTANMKHRGKPHFGLTGSMAESEIFGEVIRPVEFENWREGHNYMTRNEALRLVQESQPGNPSDPEPRFANDLQATIVERVYPNDYNRVRFFTAVGSPLDYLHHIDAFFEIDDGDFTYTITIDLKTHPVEKPATLKTDILLIYPTEGLDPNIDKEDYQSLIARTAQEIIEIFQEKQVRKSGYSKKAR